MKKKCKHNGGYTEGYICRICKEPIYTKKQADKIDRLQEQSGKAEEWRERFRKKFEIEYRQANFSAMVEDIESFIRQELSRQREEMRRAIKKEMEEKIKKLRKEQSKNPIQDFNLPHENTSEYNQAISDVFAIIGGGK